MRNMLRLLTASVILLAASLGCTFTETIAEGMNALSTPTPQEMTPVPGSTAALETDAAQETPTTEAASTSLPSQVEAVVSAQGVNLRSGPGTLFPALRFLDLYTRVNVLGKARGNEWLLVETGQEEAWVSVTFMELPEGVTPAALPLAEVGAVTVIRGQVTDTFGGPVDGVSFAVMQSDGVNLLRADAATLKDGHFYAYLPADASGTWRVALTGVSCESAIVNQDCNFIGQFVPNWKDITLPLNEPLRFQYVNP